MAVMVGVRAHLRPLVKNMFGEQQMSALADMIQAALMLRSNHRRLE